MTIQHVFAEHAEVIQTASGTLPPTLEEATRVLQGCLARGNKVLACGNGGSAASAQHFVAELVCRFCVDRQALPAIALTADVATLTAIGNDYGYSRVFARQVEALAKTGDALFAISTSGNSANVIEATKTACAGDVGREIIEQFNAGPTPDIVILSDYAKGLLAPRLIGDIMHAAAAAGVRVIVDPKRNDFSAYRGASVMTPNLHELEIATSTTFDPEDVEPMATVARSLAQDMEADALIVTLGARGMLVVPAHNPHHAICAWNHPVFDATGAGDTVVALVAVALAAGATVLEAAHIANAAAGITVGSVGTLSVHASDIAGVLATGRTRKVFDRNGLTAQVRRWRSEGKRIAFANGCFDLLHAGHLSLLHEAARHGDVLVLGVNSDASVSHLKGPARPLVSENERAAMLGALECVDAVTIFTEDTPLELLQAIRPDVLVKGRDYRIDQVVGRELVESDGGRVVLVPLLPERSTTALIDRIANRHD